MEQIAVGNQIIRYQLVVSTRAKRINLTIRQAEVIVSVPKGTKLEAVEQLLVAKSAWILKHLANYQEYLNQQKHANPPGHPVKLLYLGQSYPLSLVTAQSSQLKVELYPTGFLVTLPEGLPAEDQRAKLQVALVYWYKQQAKIILTAKLEQFATKMQVKYNMLRIKEQSTRWGSCSSKHNINLNWRLIMAPDEVINYLIVHELAHLTFMNHAPEFWQLVAYYLPEYEYWKKWLKVHGRELNLTLS